MKVGDLVQELDGGRIGIVERVDKDFYGARQALKIYQDIPRGHCIRGSMVDGIGPTREGITDRVLILWTNDHPSYEKSNTLEVITGD